MPLALAVAAALVVVTAITIRIVAASASNCAGELPVRVAAAPELAPIVADVANAWMETEPRVGGRCIEMIVEALPPPVVASSLTVYAGRAIDIAAEPEPTPSAETLPAVWIPDSSAWISRVQVVDRAAFVEDLRSIASTPVVLATTEPLGQQLGFPNPLPLSAISGMLGQSGLRFGVAEPRRETASLAMTMVLGDSLATSDEDLPLLVRTFRNLVKVTSTRELLAAIGDRADAGPATEQAVLAYNQSGGQPALVAMRLDEAGALLDYPYAIRSGVSRETSQAAAMFRSELLGSAAVSALAQRGFRAPDGTVGPGFPDSTATDPGPFAGAPVTDSAAVQTALGLWSAANSPSRTLALFDVTSSMATGMATTTGPSTRAGVMAAAAQGGLSLFTTDSRVGMWAFGAQYQEVLPIDDLTEERRQEFNQRMAAARPTASDRSELYDTLLAAYQFMLEGYDKTRPNIIVVLTDGGDSSADPLRLEEFNQELQKLADPTRPIRVVLIGIDVNESDAANLQAIANIVGGGFFPLTSPEQIQTIFLKALLRVGAA